MHVVRFIAFATISATICNGLTLLDVLSPESISRPYLNPNITETLKTAAEVFTNLGNTTIQSFVAKFQRIKEKRLLSALKGVTYTARVLSGSLVIPDEETQSYMDTININIGKLSEIIDINENNMQLYADEAILRDGMSSEAMSYKTNFYYHVVEPIKAVSRGMMEYLHLNNSTARARFLQDYEEAQLSNVTLKLPICGLYLMESRLDDLHWKRFMELRSNITRYFFQMYIVEYFNIGVQYNGLSQDATVRMNFMDTRFKMLKRRLSEVMKTASEDFNVPYLLTRTKEQIVHPAIDSAKGDNCKAAQTIVDELDSKFPHREHVAIVSDRNSTPIPYSTYGYPKRYFIEKNYSGKMVMVFITTLQSAYNKEDHYNRDSILSSNGTAMENYLDYARSGEGRERNYQMAAIYCSTHPCLRSTNSYNADLFEMAFGEERVTAAVIF